MLINGIEYSEPEVIAKFRMLSDEIVRLNEILKRYEAENLRAKELLGFAVEDFKTLVLKSTMLCNMKIVCNKCPLNCTNDNLGWKKEAEALKLIGGEK